MSSLDGLPDAPRVTPTNYVEYVEYDTHSPPPHPGADWTRFVCISDTHSKLYPLPDGDVLLHSGDLSARGSLQALERTIQWLQNMPHPVKVIIAGNHDLCLDSDWASDGSTQSNSREAFSAETLAKARDIVRGTDALRAGIHYLEHESVCIVTPGGRTWKIYGSPAATRYHTGSFQYNAGEGTAIYSRIPPTTEILLTHAPPYGILDKTRRGQHAGCKEMLARLESDGLRSCRLHVFGHIHEAHGVSLPSATECSPGRVSVNAALACGGGPVVVDLKN